jgi:hypothetical protein
MIVSLPLIVYSITFRNNLWIKRRIRYTGFLEKKLKTNKKLRCIFIGVKIFLLYNLILRLTSIYYNVHL